jgi:predicted PurR-regulated permease PerM
MRLKRPLNSTILFVMIFIIGLVVLFVLARNVFEKSNDFTESQKTEEVSKETVSFT